MTLQCPSKHDPFGQRAGGVSEGTDERGSWIFPPSSFDATVKGIPASGTASLFAGRRSNEGLGRSAMPAAGSTRGREARRRQRMSEGRRGGERRPPAPQSSGNRLRWLFIIVGDASFARSFDPFTFTPWQHFGRKPGWWGIDGGIAVGQTRASGRNRHRGLCRWTMSGSPRATALAREPRDASEEEGGHGLRPREDRRARAFWPARRTQLQKSSGDGWSRIRSANALQKERQGRVNRDLARGAGWRVVPSAGASREGFVAGRVPPVENG